MTKCMAAAGRQRRRSEARRTALGRGSSPAHREHARVGALRDRCRDVDRPQEALRGAPGQTRHPASASRSRRRDGRVRPDPCDARGGLVDRGHLEDGRPDREIESLSVLPEYAAAGSAQSFSSDSRHICTSAASTTSSWGAREQRRRHPALRAARLPTHVALPSKFAGRERNSR